MLSKSDKIWIKSLKDKKNRDLENAFVAEGSRIVLDLIKSAPDRLKMLCATPEWYAKFEPILRLNADRVRLISNELLQSVSSLKSTEEVLAVFSFPTFKSESRLESDLIIYLDQIKDPGNLGTIVRTADWFGIKQLYCSPGCVDSYNNKCVQATMSSIFRVEMIQKTWSEMMNQFPSIDKYAATATGASIYDYPKSVIGLICIGNEANGLSEEILMHCKHSVSIPSTNTLGAESLNAAVACALIMAWKKFG